MISSKHSTKDFLAALSLTQVITNEVLEDLTVCMNCCRYKAVKPARIDYVKLESIYVNYVRFASHPWPFTCPHLSTSTLIFTINFTFTSRFLAPSSTIRRLYFGRYSVYSKDNVIPSSLLEFWYIFHRFLCFLRFSENAET